MITPLRNLLDKLRRMQAVARHADQLHDAFEDRDHAPLDAHEQELLANALSFAEVTADDVCVARTDIQAVPETADFSALLLAFQSSQHSRLPVYGSDLDDIKGIIHMKDVICFVGKEDSFDMGKTLRPAVFVPENMPIPRILQLIKKTRTLLVLVTDEYGGTTGLVSLRDILEQLVGDIDDEHADEETHQVMELAPGRWRVHPQISLEDSAQRLGVQLNHYAEEDVETLGGLVMKLARRVPQRGERVPLGPGLMAVVTGSDGRRLTGLEVIADASAMEAPE